MRFISDKKSNRPMVLYHAVSSYQLLEVMLHRMLFHAKEKAVLLLPDFITGKYPQYKKLSGKNFFDRVYLFPYLYIPHREEALVTEDVSRCYRQTVPYDIRSFSDIYVAGAHFYFTLYLIQQEISFTFFEDAAGILERPEILYRALAAKFPIHAEIACRHGLFDGKNPYVRHIICHQNFSVEKALDGLNEKSRRRLIRFFIKRRIRTGAAAILLTQHFADLGIMEQEEQTRLYRNLRDRELRNISLIIKKHPDDTLDYKKIFPEAEVIRETFPAELLPYVFRQKPEFIYTFDSTGCENLKEHFTIIKVGRERYAG